MSTVLETLIQALTILRQAHALDLSRENETSVDMYIAARNDLNAVIPYIPREHADVVRSNVEEIEGRINMIKKERWTQERKSDFPTFPVEYVPKPIPVEEFKVPFNDAFRVFWLMRVLQRSMRQGAFVAPDLFVGREVWYQAGGGTALTHTGHKIRYLASLCEALEVIRSVGDLSKLDVVTQALQDFLGSTGALTATLEAEMGIHGDAGSPRSKIERGVRGFFQKGQQVLRTWMNQESNVELYLTWTMNTFEQVQVLDRWTMYYFQMQNLSAVEDVLGLLYRVIALLYTGFCSFILRDMFVLVERHQEKCRKGATLLFPVGVKLDGASS